MTDSAVEIENAAPLWRRLAPLAGLLVLIAAAIHQFGDLLSFETLAANRETLLAWRDQSYILTAALFILAYAAVVALSLPGALWMTLLGGFLFGLWPGALFNVIGATIGAVIIFSIAKTSAGAALKERAGGWVKRFEAGFRKNEISYLLMMRLTPVLPFVVANVLPATLGVALFTFAWTTFVGILPGALVYTWVGSGLGEVIARGETPNLSIIWEPHIIGPLLGLAVLSALPILLNRGGKTGDQSE